MQSRLSLGMLGMQTHVEVSLCGIANYLRILALDAILHSGSFGNSWTKINFLFSLAEQKGRTVLNLHSVLGKLYLYMYVYPKLNNVHMIHICNQ